MDVDRLPDVYQNPSLGFMRLTKNRWFRSLSLPNISKSETPRGYGWDLRHLGSRSREISMKKSHANKTALLLIYCSLKRLEEGGHQTVFLQ